MTEHFARLPRDQQRHDIKAMEHALLTKRELYRRLHGEEPMVGESHGNGIDVGYKSARLAAHGPLGILAVVFLLVGGVLIWVNHKGFADTNELLRQSIAGHQDITASQDLFGCIVSIPVAEREKLRGYNRREDFAITYCPWLRFPATRMETAR